MRNQILQGDCLEVLRSLPSQHVQMIVTSPPYFGLRDYGVEGQIGLEESPEQYVQKLVEVFREVKRVLRNDGTVWLNLGDSYSGSSKGFGSKDHGKLGKHANEFLPSPDTSGLPSKNLIGIPWRVAFALQTDNWILRSDIIWNKVNAMPESVQDRPTKSHEYVFLLSKNERYFYDADAIREPNVTETNNRNRANEQWAKNVYPNFMHPMGNGNREWNNPLGRNKRSVWSIPTTAFPDSHFAVMSPELARICILAGSAKGDLVLDPFSGAGTTALVASQLNRDYLGIELNPEYVAMSKRRLSNDMGMWESMLNPEVA